VLNGCLHVARAARWLMWMKVISTYVAAPRPFTILINEQHAGRLVPRPYAGGARLGAHGESNDAAYGDSLVRANEGALAPLSAAATRQGKDQGYHMIVRAQCLLH
jgi:hypothetical protein